MKTRKKMSEKDIYLSGHGFKLGSEEAERAWQEKCIFMCKKWPDHSLYEYYRSEITGDFHFDCAQPSMVMGDIQPYRSMIDGSMIESRSKHRAHLKQHGCIEVGNETKHLKPATMAPPPGLKEELIRQVNEKLR